MGVGATELEPDPCSCEPGQPNLLPSHEEGAAIEHAAARDPVDAASDGEEIPWVQCTRCSKWRKVASLEGVDDGADWFCWLNTADPYHSRCEDPEEGEEAAEGEGEATAD